MSPAVEELYARLLAAQAKKDMKAWKERSSLAAKQIAPKEAA